MINYSKLDLLPSARTRFIDKSKLLIAAGIPINILSTKKLRSFLSDQVELRFQQLTKQQMHSNHKNNNLNANITSSSIQIIDPAVINLSFLLDQIMGQTQCLDWETFSANEFFQPLRIIASSVTSMTSMILSRDRGHYEDLSSLLTCIRASMLVPGVTEPLIVFNGTTVVTHHDHHQEHHHHQQQQQAEQHLSNDHHQLPSLAANTITQHQLHQSINATISISTPSSSRRKSMSHFRSVAKITLRKQKLVAEKSFAMLQTWLLRRMNKNPLERVSNRFRKTLKWGWRNEQMIQNSINTTSTTASFLSKQHKNHTSSLSYLCDAFLCEPIPYRSAIAEGATHVIVLRTKPDPCRILGKKPGVYEQLIGRRFFQRYTSITNAGDWLMNLQHHRIYAEDCKFILLLKFFFHDCIDFLFLFLF
jgi:predicted patatin/cPLA2 family phospholipase